MYIQVLRQCECGSGDIYIIWIETIISECDLH